MERYVRRRHVAAVASLFAALSLVAAACGSDSSDDESRTARERTVDVTLQEFAVRPRAGLGAGWGSHVQRRQRGS
jgi:hypothetical protein